MTVHGGVLFEINSQSCYNTAYKTYYSQSWGSTGYNSKTSAGIIVIIVARPTIIVLIGSIVTRLAIKVTGLRSNRQY